MDLANLNVSITETGAQAAIDALANIAEAGNVASRSILNVIRSVEGLSTVSGIASITDTVEKLSTSTTKAATQQEILATAMNKTADSIITNQISYERLLAAQASAITSTSTLQESMGMLGSASAVLGGKQTDAKTSVEALTTAQRSSLTAMYGATDAMRSMTAEEAKAAIQGNRVAQSNIQLAIDTEKLAQAQNKTQLSAINLTSAEEKLATQMARTQLVQNQSSAVYEKANLLQTQNAAAALRSADAHDKISAALSTTQTQHTANTAAIEKHTGGWITHIATVAGGIIVYQGIREAMRVGIGFFTQGVKAVAEYEDSIISLAATWTTMAKNQTDIPATFENSVNYAEQLLPVLMDIDRYTGMTLNQSLQLTTALATRGVVLNKDNQQQIQGYTDLSNAILIMTKGQGTGRQIMQETKALMEGSVKAGNELANMVNANMNGRLKENIELWKKEGAAIGDSGYVLAKLEPYLSGYTAAMEKLKGSWSVMMSSLETTWQVLQRETFTPILKDWKASLQSINDYLKENSREISGNVQNAWNSLRGILEAIYNNWDNIKTVTEVVLGAMAVQKVYLFIASLVLLTEYVAGLSIAIGELGLITAIFGTIAAPVVIATAAIVGLGVAVYALVTNWDDVKTAWDNFIFDINSNSGVLATISNYLHDIIEKNNEWLGLFPPTQEALLDLDKGNPILDSLGNGFDRLKTKLAPVAALLELMANYLHLIDGSKTIQDKMDRVVSGGSYAGSDASSQYDSRGRLRMNSDGTPILTGAQSSAAKKASWDSFQMNMAIQQAKYTSSATQPDLKNTDVAAKAGSTTTEKFTEFNALADEINRVREAQSKLSDSSLTLAESDATLSKAQSDYNAKLTLAEALHEANLRKSDETLADKNNEKAATDALKNSYKVYTDELSVNTKLKKQATEEDKASQKALDELTKTLGLYRDAYMPLDTAVNLATVAQENLTNSNQDLEDAFKAQKQAIAEYGLGTTEAKTATEQYELALKHNIASTIIATNSDIDLKASKKGVSDEATKANKKISDFNATLSEYGAAAGLSSTLTKALEDQFKDLNKVGTDTNKTFLTLSTTLTNVGTVLGGRLGTALADIGKGLTGLNAPDVKNADGTVNNQATYTQNAMSYAAIGNGIGQMIGGGIGKSISATSSGAAIGSIFGPVGTAIGAGIGFISSLFGGGASSQDIQTAQQNSASWGANMSSMAGSGNSTAMKIMATGGYNATTIGNTNETNYAGINTTLDTLLKQNTLIGYTKEGGYGADITAAVQALGQIDTALKSMTSATIVTTLSQIDYKWKTIAAQIGDSADLQQAKLNDMIVALTGVSVDSLSTMFDSIVTSTDPTLVGKAMSDKVMQGLATSIRQMEIASFISTAVMPMLQPIMGVLATQLSSGQDTSGSFANINSVLNNLIPTMTSFANSLTAQGIAGYTDTAATTNATAATTNATAATTNLSAATVDYAAIAQERYGLETQLLTLQGDTTTLRARELALLDPSNKAMQEQIWAMQDQAQAATDSANALKSISSSLTSLVDAGSKLEAYRMTLFAGSTNSLIGLQVQKDLISQLATQALSSDYNTRVSAINGLQSSVGNAVSMAKSYYADPMELNREIARQSNLLTDVVSKQNEVTLADLKESVDTLNNTITTVVGSGNATTEEIKTILRDFQDGNGILIQNP